MTMVSTAEQQHPKLPPQLQRLQRSVSIKNDLEERNANLPMAIGLLRASAAAPSVLDESEDVVEPEFPEAMTIPPGRLWSTRQSKYFSMMDIVRGFVFSGTGNISPRLTLDLEAALVESKATVPSDSLSKRRTHRQAAKSRKVQEQGRGHT